MTDTQNHNDHSAHPRSDSTQWVRDYLLGGMLLVAMTMAGFAWADMSRRVEFNQQALSTINANGTAAGTLRDQNVRNALIELNRKVDLLVDELRRSRTPR